MPAALPALERTGQLGVGFKPEEVARYVRALQPEAREEPVTFHRAVAWLAGRCERNERSQTRRCDRDCEAADLRWAAQTIFASYELRESDDDWS